MEKNKEYIGEVLSLGSEGEGIIKIDGCQAFVPFCLTGERVSFKTLKAGKTVAYGKLTEVHTLSQHMAYPAQLEFKRKTVENCLKKLGGLSVNVSPAVASVKQYGYRNKLALPVGVNAEGENIVGFYAPRSHRIVPLTSCALQAEWSALLISALLAFMKDEGLSGYDEVKKRGDIRHLVAREVEGKLIVTVVATSLIDLTSFGEALGKKLANFTLLLNVNKGAGNAIFGIEWHICRGEGYFTGEDEGIKFKAGAQTFLQINDGVRKKLYADIVNEVKDGETVAVDLYSGGGMLTAMLAKACKAAYGIEIVPEAVA